MDGWMGILSAAAILVFYLPHPLPLVPPLEIHSAREFTPFSTGFFFLAQRLSQACDRECGLVIQKDR